MTAYNYLSHSLELIRQKRCQRKIIHPPYHYSHNMAVQLNLFFNEISLMYNSGFKWFMALFSKITCLIIYYICCCVSGCGQNCTNREFNTKTKIYKHYKLTTDVHNKNRLPYILKISFLIKLSQVLHFSLTFPNHQINFRDENNNSPAIRPFVQSISKTHEISIFQTPKFKNVL